MRRKTKWRVKVRRVKPWRWKECASCGDYVRREPMWKFFRFVCIPYWPGSGKTTRKYLCSACVTVADEASGKAERLYPSIHTEHYAAWVCSEEVVVGAES